MEHNIRIKTCRRIVKYDNLFEFVDENEYVFEFGKSYGIIGDFGMGGHTLSKLLTDSVNILNEHVYVNSVENNLYPSEFGWLVGNFLLSKYGNKEIRIDKLINKQKKNVRYYEILNYFEIDDKNLPHFLSRMPHESWRVSAATGILLDKKVFGYPFMNSRLLYDVMFGSGNALSLKKITEVGGIAIVPTNDEKLIAPIVDEVVKIDNKSFLGLAEMAKEQLNRLKLM